MIGAGPLMVIDTDVPDAERSKPEYSFFMSSSVAIALGRSLRRERILTIFDGQGKLIDEWKHLDAMHPPGSAPHRLRRNPWDSEKHVWIVDVSPQRKEHQKILKMTRDGKLVMKIGPEKFPASGPEDIAFLPNGDFWCVESDRVVKFSKDGHQLMEFGKAGSGPGEIQSGHSISIDNRGRIYVAEARNHRIQVFDQNGESLDIWPNIRIASIHRYRYERPSMGRR